MKYGYVVFDMDGTLIDTCEAIQQSLRDTIVMLTGKTPAKAEMRATFGTPSDVGLKISKSTRIRRGRFPACGSLWTGLRREAAG